MKRIYKIAITFMLMLGFAISTSSAFASFGADYYYLSEPKVSFITDRRTVDVPVTIPSTTILSPSGHSVTFNSFDTICEIKLDVTYNANTGIISSFDPVSYGVKSGCSSPWNDHTLVVKNLVPTNWKSGGITISSNQYGLEFDLDLNASVYYIINMEGMDIPEYTTTKTFSLSGSAYFEAA